MTQGSEFAVLDGNATDGIGSFQLGPGKILGLYRSKGEVPKTTGVVDITGWVEAYDNLGALWYYIPVGSVSVSRARSGLMPALCSMSLQTKILLVS